MMQIRPAAERGLTRLDWLDSRHTFSFSDYYDPEHMGFRSLRVINDDRIGPGGGFGTHGHRDMEIVTYVLSGNLAHRDSTGTGRALVRGDVQRMSAGTGIRHSEFNASKEEPVHLLQIWLQPECDGLRPEYDQRQFGDGAKQGQLRLIAAPGGRGGSLDIHQDAEIYASILAPGDRVSHDLRVGRYAWVQVATGTVTLNGKTLHAGDGAAVSDEKAIEIVGVANAELLLFDLA